MCLENCKVLKHFDKGSTEIKEPKKSQKNSKGTLVRFTIFFLEVPWFPYWTYNTKNNLVRKSRNLSFWDLLEFLWFLKNKKFLDYHIFFSRGSLISVMKLSSNQTKVNNLVRESRNLYFLRFTRVPLVSLEFFDFRNEHIKKSHNK